jgi:hypothetical protein
MRVLCVVCCVVLCCVVWCGEQVDGRAVLNHPLDVQFNTESSEGWPRIVCELWRRESIVSVSLSSGSGSGSGSGGGDATRGLLGCVALHLHI